MERIKKSMIAFATMIISWVLLSYVFFPVNPLGFEDVNFADNMVNLLPLKAVITMLFAIFSVFMYELKKKKASKN